MSAISDRASDPGLQAQRTVLAWNRTALSLAANGLLVLRSAYVGESAVIAALACVLLVTAAATHAHGRGRRQTMLAMGTLGAPGSSTLLAISVATFLACALGGCTIGWLALR